MSLLSLFQSPVKLFGDQMKEDADVAKKIQDTVKSEEFKTYAANEKKAKDLKVARAVDVIQESANKGQGNISDAIAIDMAYGTKTRDAIRDPFKFKDVLKSSANFFVPASPLSIVDPYKKAAATGLEALSAAGTAITGLLSSKEERIDDAEKIIQGYEKDKQITQEKESFDRDPLTIEKNIEDQNIIRESSYNKLRLFDEINNPSKYNLSIPDIAKKKKELQSMGFSDINTEVERFNKANDEIRKLFREVNKVEIGRSGVFQQGLFETEDDREKFVSSAIDPVFDKYLTDDASQDAYIKMQGAKTILHNILPNMARDAESLVAEGVYDNVGEFFLDQESNLYSPQEGKFRRITPANYIQGVMSVTNRLIEDNYEKYKTDDGRLDIPTLINDINNDEEVRELNKEWSTSIGMMGAVSNLNKIKNTSTIRDIYNIIPRAINIVNRYTAQDTDLHIPTIQAEKDLTQGKASLIARKVLFDPIRGNIASAALTPLAIYSAVVAPNAAISKISSMSKMYRTSGMAAKLGRFGVNGLVEMGFGLPANAIFNSYIPEGDITPHIDMGLDFLIGGVFGPGVSGPGVSFLDNVIRSLDNAKSIIEKRQIVSSLGWNVPDEYLSNTKKLSQFVYDTASMFKSQGSERVAINAIQGIRERIAGGTEQSIESLKNQAKSILSSDIFTDAQKTINKAALQDIANEQDINVVRDKLLNLINNYDPKNYSSMLNMRFIQGASAKVIAETNNALKKRFIDAGISADVLTDDFLSNITIPALLQSTSGKGDVFVRRLVDDLAEQQYNDMAKIVQENASDFKEIGAKLGKSAQLMKQDDFAERVIDAAYRTAGDANKQSGAVDVGKKVAVKRSKDVEAKKALALVDKIASDVGLERIDQIKGLKGVSKTAAIKQDIQNWLKNNNPSMSDKDIKKLANYIAPGFQGKYVAEIPGYSYKDMKQSLILDKAYEDTVLSSVDEITQPYAITDEDVSEFVSSIVKKLYGSSSDLGKKIQTSFDKFIKEYDGHEAMLAKTGIDTYIKGFVAILPNTGKKKVVIGLSGDLYDSTKKLLTKKKLSASDRVELQNTLGVVMHEFGHIAFNSMPMSTSKKVQNILTRAIIDPISTNISSDAISQVLGEGTWMIKRYKYNDLIDGYNNGNVSINQVVEELFSDVFESNFKNYIFDPVAYQNSVRSNIYAIKDKKIKAMYSAGMSTIHDYIEDAGQFVRSIIAFAYKTSPNVGDVSSVMSQIATMSIKGNPKYLASFKNPKVLFSTDPKYVNDKNINNLKNALSKGPTTVLSESFIDTMIEGYNGIPKLDDVITSIVDSIKSGKESAIELPAMYTTFEGRMLLDYFFNDVFQDSQFIQKYNTVISKSIERSLQRSAALGALGTKFFDPINKKFSFNNNGIDIADLALSIDRRVSNKGAAYRSVTNQGGVLYEYVPTLTKYMLLDGGDEAARYVGDMISYHFGKEGASNSKEEVVGVFGEEVGKSWMELYETLKKRLRDTNSMSDDAIADLLHPMIFSADEYITAVARSGKGLIDIQDDILGYLISNHGSQYAKLGLPSDGSFLRSYTFSNFAEKQLSLNSFNRSSNNFVKTNNDFSFSLTQDHFNEFAYKVNWSVFGNEFASYNKVASDYMGLIMKVSGFENIPLDKVDEIKGLIDSVISTSGELSLLPGDKKLLNAFDIAFKNFSDGIQKMNNLPGDNTLLKGYLDNMYDAVVNQGKNFYDVARANIIDNIINDSKYFPQGFDKASDDISERVLDLSVRRDEVIRQIKADEERIISNQIEDQIANLAVEDMRIDESALNLKNKTPEQIQDTIFKEKQKVYNKVLDKYKELFARTGNVEKIVFNDSILNSLLSIYKGKGGAAKLLQNADFTKIVNDAISNVYEGSKGVEYYKINPGAFGGVSVKYNRLLNILDRIDKNVPFFTSNETINNLFSRDPEAQSILQKMYGLKQTARFFNTSSGLDGSASTFFSKFKEKFAEVTKGMTKTEVHDAWKSFLNKKLGDDVVISLNNKQTELNNFLSKVFADIEDFRGRTKLGKVQYTWFTDLLGPDPSRVQHIANRISGMWNFIDNDGIARLGNTYGKELGLKDFNKNILFGGVFDERYNKAANTALYTAQQMFNTSRYFGPMGLAAGIQQGLSSAIQAKGLVSAYLIDPNLVTDIAKIVESDIDYQLFGQKLDVDLEAGVSAFPLLIGKILNEGNALLISDKIMFRQALSSSMQVALYDIAQLGGIDAVRQFVNNVKDFKKYMDMTGIDEFALVTNRMPWNRFDAMAKTLQSDIGVEYWKTMNGLIGNYQRRFDFYKSQYEPFITKTRTALNSFYVFDNIKELGSITNVTNYPWAFGLMKWSTGKASEWISGFAYEIQNVGLDKFLKNMITGESQITNRLVNEMLEAYRISFMLERVSGGEGSLDRDHIFWSLVTPLVALNMLTGSLIPNVYKTYKGIQQGAPEKSWMRAVGEGVGEWVLGLTNRIFLYANVLTRDTLEALTTAGELSDESTFADKSKVFLRTLVHEMFTKGIMRPFQQQYKGYGYDKMGMDLGTVLGAITMTDPTPVKEMNETISASYAFSDYINERGTFGSDFLAQRIPWYGIIQRGLGVIGLGNENTKYASVNRSVLASDIDKYIKAKGLDMLSNPYINKDKLNSILIDINRNYLTTKSESEGIAYNSPEEAFKKLVARGAIDDESQVYKTFKSSILGKEGIGADTTQLVFNSIPDEQMAELEQIFAKANAAIESQGAVISDKDGSFVQFAAAAHRLGIKLGYGQLLTAYIDGIGKARLLELAGGNKDVVQYVNSLKQVEGAAGSSIAKMAPGSDQAQEILRQYYSDMRSIQNALISENYDRIAREAHIAFDLTSEYFQHAKDSPIDMTNKMAGYQSVPARYIYMRQMNNILEEEGLPGNFLNTMTAVNMDIAQQLNRIKPKGTDPEDIQKAANTFIAGTNLIKEQITTLNQSVFDPGVRAFGKLSIGVAVAPIMNEIKDRSPEELNTLVTALGGGDKAAGEQLLGNVVDLLTDSAPADLQTAYEIATGKTTTKGGGGSRQRAVKQQENEKLALKAIKAYNNNVATAMKLKAAGLPLQVKLQYVKRKGTGIEPTRIAFKPERERFARTYRSIGQTLEPMKTPPLPVRRSKPIGGKVRIGNVGKAKVYSKTFKF